MANPAYSDSVRFAPGDLIARLTAFAAQTDHEFWPDDVSLRDPEVFLADRIHGLGGFGYRPSGRSGDIR